MRETVWAWAQRTVYASEVAQSSAFHRPLDHNRWGRLLADYERRDYVWPIAYEGRPLGLVIRQWAAGADSDSGITELLQKSPNWKNLVELQKYLNANPTATFAEHCNALDWSLPEWVIPNPEFFDVSESGILHRLQAFGLPAAPQTVDYLTACAQDRTDAHPSRALLVTTYAYAIVNPDGSFRFHDGNPGFVISGQHEWTVKQHIEHAYDTIQTHRSWLHEAVINPYTSREAWGKASSPEQNLTLDYYEEIKSERNLKGFKAASGSRPKSWPRIINAQIELAYDAVARRRKLRTEPTKPPTGWREWARLYLADYLKNHQS